MLSYRGAAKRPLFFVLPPTKETHGGPNKIGNKKRQAKREKYKLLNLLVFFTF